jgi:general secretion pathway protein G
MNQRQRKAGFSLIELLAVMLVIGLLAGGIVGLSRYGARKAAESAAQAEIAALEGAIQNYKIQTGAFPPTGSSGLLRLTNGFLTWPTKRITGSGLESPYGGLYQYRTPGVFNSTRFDVWTVSPDGFTTNGNFR